MKQFMYTMLVAAIITACNTATPNLGQTFTVKEPISINAVAEQLKSVPELKDVQIEGVIEKSCMSEGCWFTIKDSTGAEITFDVKDKKFRVPTNSPGKTAVILADAARDEVSEQKMTLSVKGMMFK